MSLRNFSGNEYIKFDFRLQILYFLVYYTQRLHACNKTKSEFYLKLLSILRKHSAKIIGSHGYRGFLVKCVYTRQIIIQL